MASSSKTNELDAVVARVRAHMRSLLFHRVDLTTPALAMQLGEDRSALWDMLRNDGRPPNLRVVYGLQAKFRIPAFDLLNKDPAPKFFEEGSEKNAEAQKYAPKKPRKRGPTSGASRETDLPAKIPHT